MLVWIFRKRILFPLYIGHWSTMKRTALWTFAVFFMLHRTIVMIVWEKDSNVMCGLISNWEDYYTGGESFTLAND